MANLICGGILLYISIFHVVSMELRMHQGFHILGRRNKPVSLTKIPDTLLASRIFSEEDEHDYQ